MILLMTQRFSFYHEKQLNAAVIGAEQTIKPFAIFSGPHGFNLVFTLGNSQLSQPSQNHGKTCLLQISAVKKLGILNATENASAAISAPKMPAINISCTNPRTRGIRVIRFTIAFDLNSRLLKLSPLVKRLC